jgi:hypothetical protein
MKIGHWHSGVSAAAGQKTAGQIEKENLFLTGSTGWTG